MLLYYRLLLFLTIVFFLSGSLAAQNVVLNEVMASNGQTLMDEDGDYSDWLEVYNNSGSLLNLSGYSLSDDSTDLQKWQFSEVSLDSAGFFLLFASGKDRSDYIACWETIIDQGDIWKYKAPNSEIPGWRGTDFDDRSWSEGPTGIGYGDYDDATDVGAVQTLYLRKVFQIEDPDRISAVVFHADYDDGFVAYLNGNEIARFGVGSPGDFPAYNQEAHTGHEAQMYQGSGPDMFRVNDIHALPVNGKNVLAIEVHNYGTQSSDMTMIPFLSLGFSAIPDDSRRTNPILDFSIEFHLHTNFKINAGDEWIFLTDSSGVTIDRVHILNQLTDISFGRQPDGTGDWHHFQDGSPGTSNQGTPLPEYSVPVTGLPGSGFYDSAVEISLSAEDGSQIYYTLDGRIPDVESRMYTGPFPLDATTVLRARSYKSGYLPGPVLNQTYLIGESTDLPVMSLITEPDNLWDYETGIYVLGPNASTENPYFGANFWEDWEREVHVQYYEDELLAFSEDAGMKISGAWSRAFAQKSLAIYFRNEYGQGKLNYPLFKDPDISEYNSFLLRNSGNDWPSTLFRDAMIQSLTSNMAVDRQAYQPVVVYLNGEYWGIHNLREKISEHYIESHHGYDESSIDYLEGNHWVIHGDAGHYVQLINWISSHDMNTETASTYVESMIDLDNYFDYMAIQIYCDNTDWPGNNIKYWRPRTENGRWRWVLFDLDFGFGIYDPSAYAHNTLAFALEENGPDWPNPPWSTLLFRKLMENDDLRNRFINHMADHLNFALSSEKVKQQIRSMQSRIAQEMPRHKSRWNQSLNDWNRIVNDLVAFAEKRPAYLYTHILQRFRVLGMTRIDVNCINEQGGSVRINTQEIPAFPWSGYYFNGVPVTFEAVADSGYYFAGWSGDTTTSGRKLVIDPTDRLNLTARFEVWDSAFATIVINEINYNSDMNFDSGDWVELTNKGDEPVNLAGWVFMDENDANRFMIPEGIVLEPDSYIVIAADSLMFTNCFPVIRNRTGNFDFGLSGSGEHIRLTDVSGNIVDSLTYDDDPPWPALADGSGASLELISPVRDNSRAVNWQASDGYGSPGKRNSGYTGITDQMRFAPVSEFGVSDNYPNPFNGATRLQFRLPARTLIHIEIIDIRGSTIYQRSLEYEPGVHHFRWVPATAVASGLYFYRIQFNKSSVFYGRMLYLK